MGNVEAVERGGVEGWLLPVGECVLRASETPIRYRTTGRLDCRVLGLDGRVLTGHGVGGDGVDLMGSSVHAARDRNPNTARAPGPAFVLRAGRRPSPKF